MFTQGRRGQVALQMGRKCGWQVHKLGGNLQQALAYNYVWCGTYVGWSPHAACGLQRAYSIVSRLTKIHSTLRCILRVVNLAGPAEALGG
jgi:hypothetical protein